MTDLSPRDPDSEMQAQWGALKNSSRIWQDEAAKSEFGRGVLHPQLAKELYASPFEVLIDQATKAKVWVIDAQKQLKGLLARGRKMEGDLLKAIRELETLRTELPWKVVEYKETIGFKLGL
ncbi:hypothetical protein BHE74_00017623 [Ensete ventricosum]|nr:hypothetical protein BHE74_00017623 [Ensete ventricosum]